MREALENDLVVLGGALFFAIFWAGWFLTWTRDSRLWKKRVGRAGFATLPVHGGLLLGVCVACLLAILLPPRESHDRGGGAIGRDILLVLDVSDSMAVEDLRPSRLREAKRQIDRLLPELSADRIGLITFAGSATLRCPVSDDRRVLYRALDGVDLETEKVRGTDLSAALSLAIDHLSSFDGSSAIFLFSDGEDHGRDESLSAMATRAKSLRIPVYALGLGTEEGGLVPDPRGFGFLLDDDEEPVLSKGEWSSMRRLADVSGGLFVAAKDSKDAAVFLAREGLELTVPKSLRPVLRTRPHHPLWIGLALIVAMIGFLAWSHPRPSVLT